MQCSCSLRFSGQQHCGGQGSQRVSHTSDASTGTGFPATTLSTDAREQVAPANIKTVRFLIADRDMGSLSKSAGVCCVLRTGHNQFSDFASEGADSFYAGCTRFAHCASRSAGATPTTRTSWQLICREPWDELAQVRMPAVGEQRRAKTGLLSGERRPTAGLRPALLRGGTLFQILANRPADLAHEAVQIHGNFAIEEIPMRQGIFSTLSRVLLP